MIQRRLQTQKHLLQTSVQVNIARHLHGAAYGFVGICTMRWEFRLAFVISAPDLYHSDLAWDSSAVVESFAAMVWERFNYTADITFKNNIKRQASRAGVVGWGSLNLRKW